MIKLKGMTWSHERGIKPLVEASKVYKEKYGVEIEWDARSLSDFELFPLEELADKYDFIMIDHPHIGIAVDKNSLIPLDEQLSEEFLAVQKDGAVGKSYDSYYWEGHQYAIPLDAAAQVSAYRPELMPENCKMPPRTWEDVLEVAANLPEGKKIAIPFVPVHAYSSFFTVCSQISENRGFWSEGQDLEEEVGIKGLELLESILKVAHKDSKDMDPINMLDRMMDEDEMVYCPLVYGYSNYAREGYGKNVVIFNEMPKLNEKPEGSMIGGVGLSVTTSCKHMKEAMNFVKMVSTPEFQKTNIFDEGGQPGHIEAWKDDHVNEGSNGFFINTLETLTYGSLRPRFPGYIDFQAEAGARIRKFVTECNPNKAAFVKELNELIKECRANKGLN